MRLLVTISMALLLGCQKSPSYDTYIQVEPAANPGHIFVMAIVERVPQAENKPDNGNICAEGWEPGNSGMEKQKLSKS